MTDQENPNEVLDENKAPQQEETVAENAAEETTNNPEGEGIGDKEEAEEDRKLKQLNEELNNIHGKICNILNEAHCDIRVAVNALFHATVGAISQWPDHNTRQDIRLQLAQRLIGMSLQDNFNDMKNRACEHEQPDCACEDCKCAKKADGEQPEEAADKTGAEAEE